MLEKTNLDKNTFLTKKNVCLTLEDLKMKSDIFDPAIFIQPFPLFALSDLRLVLPWAITYRNTTYYAMLTTKSHLSHESLRGRSQVH